MNRSIKNAILIFVATFLICNANTYLDYSIDLKNGLHRRLMPSADVVPNSFLPFLIYNHHTLDYSKIFDTVKLFDAPGVKDYPYFLVPAGNKLVNAYPIVTGLMAVPFYLPLLIFQKIPEISYHENILKVFLVGRITATFYTALSVGIFYLIISKFSVDEVKKITFTIFYAFGTGMYSIASRGLWLHTIAQFLFTLVLYLLTVTKDSPRKYTLLGALLGLSVINRPTSIIFAVAIAIYILIEKKKYLGQFIIAAGLMGVVLLLYNHFTFGSFITEGYSARGAANVWKGNLLESIPGFFISPARGFLFVAPILLLGFYGMYEYYKKKNILFITISVAYLLSMTMMAKWYSWHGAGGFGHRMLVDYQPFLALFAFEVFKKVQKPYLYLLGGLIAWSIYAHTNAVWFRKSRCDLNHNWTFYCFAPPDGSQEY